MTELACSVIVPSYNRAAKLDHVLRALALQDTDQPFEVIVVLDGATDASRSLLETWDEIGAFASFRWIEQPRQGQATARNNGSFMAQAPVLLFLDDDVLPDIDLVRIHLMHHASGERIALLGDCEMTRHDTMPFSELVTWSWWEDNNHRRAAAGQPASYRDFCTGNVSLRRDDFAQVGGFDGDFTGYGREDYELGYRLMRSGVRLVSDRNAHARHLTFPSVQDKCDIARKEAQGDVLMARKHPELIAGLRFARGMDRRLRIAAGLAMFAPWAGAIVCAIKRGFLRVWEQFCLRKRWLRSFTFLWTYSYWRGLRASAGSLKAVRALRAMALPELRQQIDVLQPLEPQVRALNIDVPSRLIVSAGDEAIAMLTIPAELEEPLAPWLARELSGRLSETLVLALARDVLAGGASKRRVLETG